MLEELRLNPRSPGVRSWGRCPGKRAPSDRDGMQTTLSTGFAERADPRSTGQVAWLGCVEVMG
jgi:hypothetical protein